MNHSLDPLVIATTLAAIIFSPAIAAVVGPYSVIIICSILGAAIGLGRRQQATTRLRAFGFYLKMSAVAMLLTAPLAAVASTYLGIPESRWLLSPVALMIGVVGSNWRDVGQWALQSLRDRVSASTQKGGKRK